MELQKSIQQIFLLVDDLQLNFSELSDSVNNLNEEANELKNKLSAEAIFDGSKGGKANEKSSNETESNQTDNTKTDITFAPDWSHRLWHFSHSVDLLDLYETVEDQELVVKSVLNLLIKQLANGHNESLTNQEIYHTLMAVSLTVKDMAAVFQAFTESNAEDNNDVAVYEIIKNLIKDAQAKLNLLDDQYCEDEKQNSSITISTVQCVIQDIVNVKMSVDTLSDARKKQVA